MWAVLKAKNNSLQFLLQNLEKKFGYKLQSYYPKFVFKKNKNKSVSDVTYKILGNYFFCYDVNFKDPKFLNKIKYIKGLNYVLSGFETDQINIKNFINFCKKNENEEGILKPSFFHEIKKMKGKFLNGPFANMFFDIIEKDKKSFRFLIGNFKVNVKNTSELYFLP